jgi:hypothetical protein
MAKRRARAIALEKERGMETAIAPEKAHAMGTSLARECEKATALERVTAPEKENGKAKCDAMRKVSEEPGKEQMPISMIAS